MTSGLLFFCARPRPFAFPCPPPRLLPGPASRPSPVPDLPVRFPCPALPGDGNGWKCRPCVLRCPVGRRNGAEVFPGRAARHRWATEWGRNVPRACGAAPLGYGNERKCCPGVLRGTVGRRNGAEVFPECAARHPWATEWVEMSPGRATRHPWATETGRSVPRACGNAPSGDGMGPKCSPSVRRGQIGRRNGTEVFPEREVRPPWATEGGEAVARACLETL